MAAVDTFDIKIAGHGGHAAYPSKCVDPIVIGATLVSAMQGIVARMVAPQDMAVVSITNFKAGTGAYNVIPDEAEITGTVRTFSPEVRDMIESRIKTMANDVCVAYGAKVSFEYTREIDATINNPEHTEICAAAMARIIGLENINRDIQPSLGGEDFGGMLMQVPGAYIHVGQGVADKNSPHNKGLHNAGYDFNDEILPICMDYFAELVESSLPLK
jgi:hippurate hydrolase